MTRRRLLLAALAAVAALAGFALVRTPVPASSGPPVQPSGGENAPHTHVGMVGMSGGTVPVGGTSARAGGYAFVPSRTGFAAGVPAAFTFQVLGPDGRPVTRFALVHDRLLHLVVVREDLSGYQHLHPTMAAGGTWSIELTLPEPGRYRAYADFSALDARGAQTAAVLAVALTVPGAAPARPLPGPSRTATVAGFTVSVAGTPATGVVQPVLFRVDDAGTPAVLQPYLGAYGHLVMLRQADLGYLHIHPEAQLLDGAIVFWVAAPGTGTYRLYLDFQVAGAVHTAEFTIAVS